MRMRLKKTHLLALLIAAVAMVLVISTFEQASQYVNFEQARALIDTHSAPAVVHVIGKLPKDPQGETQGIQESADHRAFSFLLTDAAGETQEVRYPLPMPADFLYAEQIVIIGHATPTHFEAQKILLKCPSKYETGDTGDTWDK